MKAPQSIDATAFLLIAQAIVGLECRVSLDGDKADDLCTVYSVAPPRRTYTFWATSEDRGFYPQVVSELLKGRDVVLTPVEPEVPK